jgi:hypothetical protein
MNVHLLSPLLLGSTGNFLVVPRRSLTPLGLRVLVRPPKAPNSVSILQLVLYLCGEEKFEAEEEVGGLSAYFTMVSSVSSLPTPWEGGGLTRIRGCVLRRLQSPLKPQSSPRAEAFPGPVAEPAAGGCT